MHPNRENMSDVHENIITSAEQICCNDGVEDEGLKSSCPMNLISEKKRLRLIYFKTRSLGNSVENCEAAKEILHRKHFQKTTQSQLMNREHPAKCLTTSAAQLQ
jgi:predicted metal-binding protein